jgi:hypothetical protein
MGAGLSFLFLLGFTHIIIEYVDHVCAQPELGFFLILMWLGGSFILVFTFFWLISPEVISTSIFQKWLKFHRHKKYVHDQIDPRDLQGSADKRFWRWCMVGMALVLAWSHVGYDRFLMRYQKLGSTLAALRSDDSILQDRGLKELKENSLFISVIKPLPKDLFDRLEVILLSPNQDLQKKALFMVGELNLVDLAPVLRKMSVTSPQLGNEIITALGHIQVTTIKQHQAHQTLYTLIKHPHLVQQYPLAFARAFGLQGLIAHDPLKNLYQTHLTQDATSLKSIQVRQLSIWALGQTKDQVLVPFLSKGLLDPELSIRCLSAHALEKIVAFESSRPLQRAFEVSKKKDQCPRIELPDSSQDFAIELLPKRAYQLVLARALATTDDPELLKWMVDHQEGIDIMAHKLLYKYYQVLEKKEKKGYLERFKRINKRLNRSAQSKKTTQPTH